MSARGFTGWDILILLSTVVLLLALVFLANKPSSGRRGGPVQCVSNQKQIALAFRMWSNDHGDRYPMSIPSARGGAQEFALAGDPVACFVVISNEMNSPQPLLCADDTKRGPRASVFDGLSAKNVSYMVGVDANETNAGAILTADRNVVLADLKQPKGLFVISDYKTAQWSGEIHKQQGNIALADGSAFQCTTDNLQRALRDSGLATNRFAVP